MVEYTDPEADVPSPIDLRTEKDAAAWAESADRQRPWREQLRQRFAELVGALPSGASVLELGAGPGLLAESILGECPGVARYTLLDFSEPMLAMSRARLKRFSCAEFKLGDFKSAGWWAALDSEYTVVVAMQSVHELRNKRHVPQLYRQIRRVLGAEGVIMVCDHVPNDQSLRWTSLHMTAEEQSDAMRSAGFTDIRVDRRIERLYLVVGRNCSPRGERG